MSPVRNSVVLWQNVSSSSTAVASYVVDTSEYTSNEPSDEAQTVENLVYSVIIHESSKGEEDEGADGGDEKKQSSPSSPHILYRSFKY